MEFNIGLIYEKLSWIMYQFKFNHEMSKVCRHKTVRLVIKEKLKSDICYYYLLPSVKSSCLHSAICELITTTRTKKETIMILLLK